MTAVESDLRGFLTRLMRLDPRALVRLRPDPPAAWAMLPFRVLVCRTLGSPPAADETYAAADLLGRLETGAPAGRRDEAWRWPLPPAPALVLETIPVADVVRLADAAARTVRTAATEGVRGRAVGERMLRDAVLDHVAIVVTTDDGQRLEVPQRVIQALVRMDLLGVIDGTVGTETVTVRRAMAWIGVSSRDGSAWYRPISPLHLS
jgi:hypothetical protein